MRGAGLKIGMDARLMGDRPSGIGHYISELSRALVELLPGAEFFLYAPWPIHMPVASPRWRARIDPWSKAFERARGLWMTKHAWMLLRTRTLCLRDGINVFWATDAPFIPYLPKSVRVVATVYDVRYRLAPETQRKSTLYVRRLLEKRHTRADALTVISQGTADKLCQYLGYKAAAVVRPAVSAEFYRRDEDEIARVLERYRIQTPYLLSIANADATPHKNTGLLIKVFRDLTREGRLQKYSLVLGGLKSEQLLDTFRREFGEEILKVVALGYVDGADLPALYSGADAFAFPSLYEGFGIPVLEARACQTRIVTTDSAELREAGGNRAVYTTPDAAGIRAGIIAALAAERPSEPERLWTWKSSAEILTDALDPRL
jgi:glycosyltransferase involved in cell wall biosynthesis